MARAAARPAVPSTRWPTPDSTCEAQLSDIELRAVRYDSPEVQHLVDLVQQEYRERYRSPDGDSSPIDAEEFLAPNGCFFAAFRGAKAVAMGGWRWSGPEEGDAELKRMFVVREERGRGLSRLMLAELESSARSSRARRLVLETGTEQPEAVGLYVSSGFEPIEAFGHYACAPESLHFGKRLD